MATRPCSECKKWLYRDDGTIATRGGKKVPRSGTKPPCWKCPKKSPEEAHNYELSAKNGKALEVYWRVQGAGHSILSERERRDVILQMNLALIHRIVTNYESAQQTSGLVSALLSVATK